MERLIFMTIMLGCLITGLSAKENYTVVRLEATEALKDLISPNFPSNYPIYEKIMYILTAQDSHNGIAIKFSYFLMESSPNCEADSLKMYKANYEFKFLVKTYCGHKKPSNIFIPENNITLVFTTNGYQEKRGFRLQYYATRTNPYPEKNSESGSAADGIPIGIGISFGVCAFLAFVYMCHKKNAKKLAEEKKQAETKKKADAKKKAETEAKKKAETEAQENAETEAQQKDEAKKKEETKQKAEETEKENKKTICDKNMPVNQSTQTLIQPLQPFNQTAYGLSQPLIPIGQPAQPRTQPLPPINETIHTISQHFPPNDLQSQAQPLFYPIDMLYPPIQDEHSHPIHLVQPVSNNPSFTRQLVGTGPSEETRNRGFAGVQPPSYEAHSFDHNIPETKLL